MNPFVPPGGFAGLNAQTVAAKASMGLLRTAKKAATRTVRRKAKKAAKRVKRTASRKLKFGSPAWQKKYGNKARRKK